MEKEIKTEADALEAVCLHLTLDKIPIYLQTIDVCIRALKHYGNIQHIPDAFKTICFFEKSYKLHGTCFRITS